MSLPPFLPPSLPPTLPPSLPGFLQCQCPQHTPFHVRRKRLVKHHPRPTGRTILGLQVSPSSLPPSLPPTLPGFLQCQRPQHSPLCEGRKRIVKHHSSTSRKLNVGEEEERQIAYMRGRCDLGDKFRVVNRAVCAGGWKGGREGEVARVVRNHASHQREQFDTMRS